MLLSHYAATMLLRCFAADSHAPPFFADDDSPLDAAPLLPFSCRRRFDAIFHLFYAIAAAFVTSLFAAVF